MDFLSWRKLHPELQADSIMLNSLTLLPKLIPSLHPYPIIESFLDNDEAGDRATKQLIDAGLTVKDMRACYDPYKDINEYLILVEQRKQILTLANEDCVDKAMCSATQLEEVNVETSRSRRLEPKLPRALEK